MRIGIVSGYFNPLHYGHIEYINGAKERSDILICLINSDHQVSLKGSRPFMDETHRLKIMESLKSVDLAMISIDKDKTQCASLKFLKKKYPKDMLTFYNSGDRIGANLDSDESKVCKEIGIELVILEMPKIYSSSHLLSDVVEKI